jgi:3'(2'),5'-bisphosphate nucleotidase
MMVVLQEQLQALCAIVEAAGKEVMDVYATDFQCTLKQDSSPLTDADLRADAAIRRGLEISFPGIFILSEESASSDVAKGETFFLVDPLDGTKEFLSRSGEFTVNVAWIYKGEAVAGVVLAPALGELFFAAKGLGAWKRCNGKTVRLEPGARTVNQTLRVIGSKSHGANELIAWLAQLRRTHTLQSVGSSLKFCRIAEGQADVYPRLGPTSQWDTAAAQCVLECSGGRVTDLLGKTLRYGLERPILNPKFIASGPGGDLA